MGYFGIFSAILNGNPDDIALFFKNHFKENISQRKDREDFYYRDDILIYSSQNGWVVIKWSREFFSYDETSKILSKTFDALVSAVNIYDGDFWEHKFYKNGELLDTFHSAPDYFEEINEKLLRFIDPGKPHVIAEELKIEVEKISPYFNRERNLDALPKKAFPEDIYNVSDGLVFIDFWNKIGIRLPEDHEIPQHAFEMDDKYMREMMFARF